MTQRKKIEKAKELYKTANADKRYVLESEGENIRKWLITQLELKSDVNNPHDLELMILKSIAWLEESDETKAKMFLVNKGYPIDANGTFPTYEEMYNIIKEGLEKQNNKELEEQLDKMIEADLSWLEKQDEPIGDTDTVDSNEDGLIAETISSKFADKDEPMFKASDWLVHNERRNIIKVVNATPLDYEVVDVLGHHHTITDTAIENNYHLWSIKDAKDGDILVVENIIFIYKRVLASHIVSYCKLINDVFEPTVDARTCCEGNPYVYPATKEQRELLFAKMEEADYEFDFEKKELKKIEQNNTEEYIETKGLSELEAEAEELTKEISDEIEADKVVIKQGEHNSAWSEEDTETLNGIVNYLFTSTDVSSIEGSDKWYDWLKSLKDRVQPKQEWDEEDERIYKSITYSFANNYPLTVQQQEFVKSLRPQKLCVYNPYKAVVESIAKMCDKYKNRMCDEKEAKDFLANVAVKCREAAEYDKKYMEE